MHFNCTFCGGKIEGEESWIGMEAECPYCKMQITVPESMVHNLPPLPPTPVAKTLPTESEAAEAANDTSNAEAIHTNNVTSGEGGAGTAPDNVHGKWVIGGVVALLLLIFGVVGSGVLTRETSLIGYWEDTHGLNVRIEVKPDNLLVIYIPLPGSDGPDIDMRGSYGPSDKEPTYVLTGGEYHTCKLDGVEFVVDGVPFAGRSYHFRRRK
jgi:hypothetical protein